MHEYTASESLRKHMLGVEAAMRAYAEHFGEDPDRWALAGLIHDFDYERYPNADPFGHRGASVVGRASSARARLAGGRVAGHSWPRDVLRRPRETRMARTLFAVDELSGLITATALVKPTKSVHDVDAKSVRKKMKDKAFAKGVNRDDVLLGVQELGVDLDAHIQFVIDAMRRSADALGLAGTAASGAGDAAR